MQEQKWTLTTQEQTVMPAAANSVVTSPIMPEIIALLHLVLYRVFVNQFPNKSLAPEEISLKAFWISNNHILFIPYDTVGSLM